MAPGETLIPKSGALRRCAGSLLRLVAVFAVLYALVCVGARWISTSMIFPAPAPTYGAKIRGLVTIPGAQGQKFAGVYLPNATAKQLVIFFHGNGEDLGSATGQIDGRWQRGFAVLAVDYPGYGATGGQASEQGLYDSADAAYRYATQTLNWPKERIIVNGFSLGGAAALWLASRQQVGGLILQSAFMSAYRVMTGYPLVLGDRMPNLARIKKVRCPVLVIHGFDDGVIAWEHGRRLFEAAPEPKRCFWVAGGGHNNLPEVAGESYWRAITDFADGKGGPACSTVGQ